MQYRVIHEELHGSHDFHESCLPCRLILSIIVRHYIVHEVSITDIDISIEMGKHTSFMLSLKTRMMLIDVSYKGILIMMSVDE